MDACRGERRIRSYETSDEGLTDPCSDCVRKPAQLLPEALTLHVLSAGIYATVTGIEIGQWELFAESCHALSSCAYSPDRDNLMGMNGEVELIILTHRQALLVSF